MTLLKRFTEIAILFVVLPLVVLFWAGIAIAVGVKALVIYSGAIIAAWMFAAIGLPMLFGVITPRELVDAFRSRWRSGRYYEGEPLAGRSWTLRRRRSTPSEDE